jgi:hypothetical protein
MTEIVQQYPSDSGDTGAAKSMRLNHPDWGDVNKTTYVKGVIVDFKVALKSECDPLLYYPGKFEGEYQVDPFRVKSVALVRIGEQESWLPIFYHPKAAMWDDSDMVVWGTGSKEFTVNPGVLATDFNQDAGYFEKAWMSFRPGDEVVVMLQEAIPLAVIGFADGVPRIGEAVFKVNISPVSGSVLGPEEPRYVMLAEEKINPFSDKGADGLDLRLVKEVSPIIVSNYAYSEIYHYYIYSYHYAWIFALGPKLVVITQWYNYTTHEGGGYGSMNNRIYIAVATDENIAIANAIAVAHSVSWIYQDIFENVPGFYRQTDIIVSGTGNLNTLSYTYPVPPKHNKFISIFVRPHTKEELQETGMWPHEGS